MTVVLVAPDGETNLERTQGWVDELKDRGHSRWYADSSWIVDAVVAHTSCRAVRPPRRRHVWQGPVVISRGRCRCCRWLAEYLWSHGAS